MPVITCLHLGERRMFGLLLSTTGVCMAGFSPVPGNLRGQRLFSFTATVEIFRMLRGLANDLRAAGSMCCYLITVATVKVREIFGMRGIFMPMGTRPSLTLSARDRLRRKRSCFTVSHLELPSSPM